MLVVKVHEDDMLLLGDDVRIYVRHVGGGAVKLCIDAPRELEITRLPAPEAPPAAAASPRDPVAPPLRGSRRRPAASEGP